MELKKNVMQCYQQVLDTTIAQEETQEAIVPDACPDILRIISVCGQICISEKEVGTEGIVMKGQVEATVLYQPEEGRGIEKITVRMPFQSETQGSPLESGDEVFVVPTLCRGEARILNPRKILVRADILLEVSGYQCNELVLCCGVEQGEAQGMEERIMEKEIKPLCAVKTTHFTFDETISLQGQEDLEEVMSVRIMPYASESKVIGNKLIYKGETEIHILYLNTQGELEHSHHLLPFSQIMEVEDSGEEGKPSVSLVLESFYVSPGYNGGRQLDVTIDLMAQATVRGEKQLSLLEDAYSIYQQIAVEKDQYTLVTVAEEFLVPQSIRQIFETTMPIQRVEDARVASGRVTQSRDGNQLTFSSELLITLLCCDESGAWQSLEFPYPISHQIDCPEHVTSCCRALTLGEVFTSVAPGGVELRFTPQFSYSMVETEPVTVVVSTTLGEPRERGVSTVVLRLPQGEETLWDIAKNYGTTTGQIIQANCLEEDILPQGQMLLIPSIR